MPKRTAKAESIVIVEVVEVEAEGDEKPSKPKVAAVAMMEEPAARVLTGRWSDKGPMMTSPRMRPTEARDRRVAP